MKWIAAILLSLLALNPSVNTDIRLPPLKELMCLVHNVYYEARGESFKGQVAVALVTIFRTQDARYPSTICGVVYQRKQFSWTHQKRKKIDDKEIMQSIEAAYTAYTNRYALGNFYATHFHASYVRPGWKLHRVIKIGTHIFYY